MENKEDEEQEIKKRRIIIEEEPVIKQPEPELKLELESEPVIKQPEPEPVSESHVAVEQDINSQYYLETKEDLKHSIASIIKTYPSVVDIIETTDWCLINPLIRSTSSYAQGNIRMFSSNNAVALLGQKLFLECKSTYGIDDTLRIARSIHDSLLSKIFISTRLIYLHKYVDLVKRTKSCGLKTLIEYVRQNNPIIYYCLIVIFTVLIIYICYRFASFTKRSIAIAVSAVVSSSSATISQPILSETISSAAPENEEEEVLLLQTQPPEPHRVSLLLEPNIILK